ncbi:MAG: helix-turn-helix domain-containing protein [Acutalibacteraceae bacterium]
MTAKPGSITYVPAGIDFQRISSKEKLVVIHLQHFGNEFNEIESINPKRYSFFSALFMQLLNERKEQNSGYYNRCMALLYQIFGAIEKSELSENNQAEMIIMNGIDYIHKNYMRSDLTISEISEQCHMSEVNFRRVFKLTFNISPLNYINNLRIKEACSLLESGYYSVSDIAILSGFSGLKYFGTSFKRTTGISPSEYKKYLS